MYLAHTDACLIRSFDLSVNAQLDQAEALAFREQTQGPGMRNVLRQFIERLPPYDDLVKIGPSFHELAADCGAEISDLIWWDIALPYQLLLGTVRRDETTLLAAFHWKDTAKGTNPHPVPSRHSWVRDLQAPGGWRYEFESPTYQEVKATFAHWLRQPFSPQP